MSVTASGAASATSTTADVEARPLRADARRNRERLLAAADEAFAQAGTTASLEDIAQQAGVGIGTLYRHFPTRSHLVAALIDDRAQQVVRQAEELADADDPFEAMETWLGAWMRHGQAYNGLAESLAEAEAAGTCLSTTCEQIRAALGGLLQRAQDEGLVRADVTADDVVALASSIAWVSERAVQPRPTRLLRVVLDGLRPR
jgi:AcrR family transcriptional regulator